MKNLIHDIKNKNSPFTHFNFSPQLFAFFPILSSSLPFIQQVYTQKLFNRKEEKKEESDGGD